MSNRTQAEETVTTQPRSASEVTVVGIGADGWNGLGLPAQNALHRADAVIGSRRQLELVPPQVGARRVGWPSPLLPALPGLLEEHAGGPLVVLASGDPMFFGIGQAITGLLGAGAVTVLPQASSVSLACARLGWSVENVPVVSLVGRPLAALRLDVHDGRRLLVLSGAASTPAEVASALRQWGFGPSRMTVLEQLGSPAERSLAGTAETWDEPPGDALNVLALECVTDGTGSRLSLTAGLDDDAYEHDGQLTKREVRAVTLAVLAPIPGELLWDVGGGAGSIGIEWMRAHRSCRALCIESDPARGQRIATNAAALGVPTLQVVTGRAPAALVGLPTPDAVFVGGGLTVEGTLEACWAALRPGGRLVANTVTVESEAVLAQWHSSFGGELRRVSVSRGRPVGRFTGWDPGMPVTQWNVVKPREKQERT
ncbi:MAG: precorrin-6y C5,15-methyltransferase (decarboxylating) subunit CbiE [Mycobacteriaceae bacterium]